LLNIAPEASQLPEPTPFSSAVSVIHPGQHCFQPQRGSCMHFWAPVLSALHQQLEQEQQQQQQQQHKLLPVLRQPTLSATGVLGQKRMDSRKRCQ
jgi:hypothetical protein